MNHGVTALPFPVINPEAETRRAGFVLISAMKRSRLSICRARLPANNIGRFCPRVN
jgi:hypothetical protein